MNSRILLLGMIVAALVGLSASTEPLPTQEIFLSEDSKDTKNEAEEEYDISYEDKETIDDLIKVLENILEFHNEHKIGQDIKRSYNKNQLRRHQASKWDIGFGKRSSDWTGTNFLKSLFDSSKMKKFENFNRKQHWDVTYGRK